MNKGFTLIELLITITVVLTGVFGAYIAIGQGITIVDYARSRLTAAFLAQEGVEIVKNIRDTNLLEHRAGSEDWDNGLFAGEYEVEADGTGYDIFSVGSQLRFLKKTEHGFYNYSSGENTRYQRKVAIEKLADDHLRITVTVYWKTRLGKLKEFKVIQEMYKWW